jgi:hypothetical protein
MSDHTAGPVTLGDLRSAGKLIWCYCNACCRERDLSPDALPLADDVPVMLIGKRMRCQGCGVLGKVTTKPELYPGGVVARRPISP